MEHDDGFGGEDVPYTWDSYDENDGRSISSMDEHHVRNNQNYPTNIHVGTYEGSSSIDEQMMNYVQETDGSNCLEEPKPLGLTLRKTPSVLNFIQMRLANTNSSVENMAEKDLAEKLKAINIPLLFLKIGSWELESKHVGHLVAKCYFAKRKLIWEILKGSLKRKLEMSWSDVIGLRVMMTDQTNGGCDIMDIELNQPPSFAKELNPQPRKHTQWSEAMDFTEGQALIHRRHHMKFPPGYLDKLYNKLLQNDERILMLSKQTFPTHPCPYFSRNDTIHYSQLFQGHPSSMVPRLQPPMSNGFSTPLLQLPPPNGFSTPVPGYFQNLTTSTGPPQFPLTNANIVMSGLNEVLNNFELQQGGVNEVPSNCGQQLFGNPNANMNILLWNATDVVEQNGVLLQPVLENIFPETTQPNPEYSIHNSFPNQTFNTTSHLHNTTAYSTAEIDQETGMNAVQTGCLNEANLLGRRNYAFPSTDVLIGINIDEEMMGGFHPMLNEAVTLQDLLDSSAQAFGTPTTNSEAYKYE